MSTTADDHGAIRPEPPTTYYDDITEIPGYGDAPNRCRPMQPVGFCDHGHPILGRSSCGCRYCPDHWRDWCEDATISIVARLAAYRHAVDGAEKRLSHIVASPPPDRRYSVRELWETRTDAYDALREAGVHGGATVTHPFRTNERGNALYETAREEGEASEGTGRWRFLRDVSEDMGDLSRYVEASPHYHVMGAAEDVAGGDAPEGWVVERIRTFKPFYYRDTEAYRDMARSVYYVLTHGATQQGRQTTAYYGSVHPASFRPEEELASGVWARIQEEAEKAVKAEPGEEVGHGAGGPEECPRDGCEAVVHDLELLGEYLDDDGWVSDLLHTSGGRERWQRLRGAWLWSEGMTDRPPPSALTSEKKLLEWLKARGESHTPEPQQAGLSGWAGGVPWRA